MVRVGARGACAAAQRVTVTSIVIPALVATVVTLGIEFFAKPSLESRKDRILEHQRRRRAVLRQANSIRWALARLAFELGAPEIPSKDHYEDVHSALRREFDSFVEAVIAGGAEKEQRPMLWFAAPIEAYFYMRRHAIIPAEALNRMVLDDLVPLTEQLVAVMATPRWRRRRRRRAMSALSAASDSLGGPP